MTIIAPRSESTPDAIADIGGDRHVRASAAKTAARKADQARKNRRLIDGLVIIVVGAALEIGMTTCQVPEDVSRGVTVCLVVWAAAATALVASSGER